MKDHKLVCDNNRNIINLMLNLSSVKWQIMLGSLLESVTLHGRFTISIEQD